MANTDTQRHVGKRIGKYEVISFVRRGRSLTKWRCRCDCGREFEIWSSEFSKGRVSSCGCDKPKKVRQFVKPGDYPRPEYDRLYSGMVSRCHSKSNKSYKNYGGRGN